MTIKKALSDRVPPNALGYCIELWEESPFNFMISQTRSTCLGNYKFRNGSHHISVNHDLNPYRFLITYIHEVAHLKVKEKYTYRAQPHGPEWKLEFMTLMDPMLNSKVFPSSLLHHVQRHMLNPSASSSSDTPLNKALNTYDKHDFLTLEDIPYKAYFGFKRRIYQKIKLRRTKVLISCPFSMKQYTLPLHAKVEELGKEDKKWLHEELKKIKHL